MQTFLTETDARDHIRAQGIPIGEQSLKDHRHRGTGPKYTIINKRVVYTREWIQEWIDGFVARATVRPAGRRRKQSEAA